MNELNISAVDATAMETATTTSATQAFTAGTGKVDTSSFCTVLKSVICLIGGGVSLWGVVNLLEGYGNDHPGAKSQGMKQAHGWSWSDSARYYPCSCS